MHPTDLAAIGRCFDSITLDRGMSYFRGGRVLRVEIDEDSIRSRVLGSRKEAYSQEITIHRGADSVSIDGHCSCPMEYDCKHVAAVALYLAEKLPKEFARLTGGELGSSFDHPSLRVDPNVELWLNQVYSQLRPTNEYPPEVQNRLFYVLRFRHVGNASMALLDLLSARRLKDGKYGKTSKVSMSNVYGGTWPRYVLPTDAKLITSIYKNCSTVGYSDAAFRLEGAEGARHLEMILDTGRCVFDDVNAKPLSRGESRPAHLRWSEGKDGIQTLSFEAGDLVVLPTAPPYYIDTATGECGPLDASVSVPVLQALLGAPAVRPESAGRVREELSRLLPENPELWPEDRRPPIVRRIDPVPMLQIRRANCQARAFSYYERRSNLPFEQVLPIARLEFGYGVARVRGPGEEIRLMEGDQLVIMPRQHTVEAMFRAEIRALGWHPGSSETIWKLPKGSADDYVIAPDHTRSPDAARAEFYDFLRTAVPTLRQNGWVVTVEGNLEVPPAESVRWEIGATEDGNDWFKLNLGVVVDGERVDLRPILIAALGRVAKWDGLVDFDIYHELPNGKVLALPASRIHPLVVALQELFGDSVNWNSDLALPVSRAAETSLLEDAAPEWQPPERLRELRSQLSVFERIEQIETPASLAGTLRPYQSQGLSWLQFLRQYSFGGVLADDMGLGKTVQTLAHILVEKEQGRLTNPVLIVAPTSTIPNWRYEAQRFAPSLQVLTLHGPERKTLFGKIASSDLVLTTYALLSRDRDILAPHQFHIVVLDEAQNIKNPAAATTQAACALRANQRICLSGTPVENNLDELWSLMSFLMPGFLGSLTAFRRDFRSPIEREQNKEVQARLQRRIRPFVLRRTKQQVATELPPKTEVIERVELASSQRDLYESLRLAMDSKVRDLLSTKGLNRSRIEILDALLKLRQVCCDPRLVKLESARKAKGSAKLERLMEMLAELRGEGRRVLLFSQFTSMLDLIEESLRPAGYDWVRISGDTKDRATPVKRFQAGEVELFLISLKAGGTGLNLTAADTVIHYDPWWNPAVENQATDRAHRIGQDKAVFVYKLVASGTVEEKMLELQERKASLAAAVLSGAEDAAHALTAEDLRWVLE